MIDTAEFLTGLLGEPPRPGNTAAFALLFDRPARSTAWPPGCAAAGHTVVTAAYDAPWGQRYATVADPDGYRVDLFALPLSGPRDRQAGAGHRSGGPAPGRAR